jgi:hypothetical protein
MLLLSLSWLLVASVEGGAVSPALQEKLPLLHRARDRHGGEPHAGEQEPGVAHGQLARRVHRHVAVPAQDRPVLLAEQEPPLLLHDIENRFRTQESIELWQPRLS